MKIIFVHDHVFKSKSNDFYSSGGLPASVWSRYLSAFSEITVVGRDGGELIEDGSYTLSSAPNVYFKLLGNASNFRSLVFKDYKRELIIEKLVAEHSGIICRLPSRLGVLFIKEAIKQNKPYAIELVACPWDAYWNYGGLKAKFYAPIVTYETKALLLRSKFSLYVTEHFLQSRYPSSANAITTFCSNVEIGSVDIGVLDKRIDKIKSLTDAGLEIKFGLIGSYSSKYKGIDVAIKALAKSGIENWSFQILGKGDSTPYRLLAQKLGVADKVHFVGALPAGEPVMKWLDQIDIYLQPSFQEGLPRALIEAMSRGCPCLATRVAGIPELLEQSEMVAPGDYLELAKRISEIVGNKSYLVTLANTNFKKAENYYKSELDSRRNAFWLSFKQSIQSEK